MDPASYVLDERQAERNFAVDRFHDQLVARLIELRYKRLTPAHLLLMLPLLAEPPLLALAMAGDERRTQSMLRDLKFILPFFMPALHCLFCSLVVANSYGFGWPTYTLWDGLPPWFWLPVVFSTACGAALSVWLVRRMGVLRADIRYWLEESSLMSMLACIDDRLWAILDYVPLIFHTPFMLVRRRSPQSAMDLVGSNLDWYLDEPRTLVRANWIAELLLPALTLELILFVPTNGGLVSVVGGPLWHVLALAVAVCLIFMAYAARRREVFLEELILHLRREFES